VIEGVGTVANRQRELEGIGNGENPNWRESERKHDIREEVFG